MIVPPDELETQASNAVLQAPGEPVADSRRVRVVLIGIVVLALVAALAIWWLSR